MKGWFNGGENILTLPLRRIKLYTLMEHLITSQRLTLTVFR